MTIEQEASTEVEVVKGKEERWRETRKHLRVHGYPGPLVAGYQA